MKIADLNLYENRIIPEASVLICQAQPRSYVHNRSEFFQVFSEGRQCHLLIQWRFKAAQVKGR